MVLVFELLFNASLDGRKKGSFQNCRCDKDSLLAIYNHPFHCHMIHIMETRIGRKDTMENVSTYSSICETLSEPNFHGAGKSCFDAFDKRSSLSHSDFRTTRTTSPKYFPLMYFSNLKSKNEHFEILVGYLEMYNN